LRAQLTPSGRGKRPPTDEELTGANSDHRSLEEKRRSMTWAQRLKRVFNIDVSTCGHCGGTLRIVASIEEPTANNPPPSAPSSPTSKSTARWRKRTTDPPRAHRPLWLRDTPPGTTPKAKPGRPHEAATIPQGSARPAVGNRWEIATSGAAEHPSTRPNAPR